MSLTDATPVVTAFTRLLTRRANDAVLTQAEEVGRCRHGRPPVKAANANSSCARTSNFLDVGVSRVKEECLVVASRLGVALRHERGRVVGDGFRVSDTLWRSAMEARRHNQVDARHATLYTSG